MECQSQFSGEKDKYFKMSSADILPSMLSINLSKDDSGHLRLHMSPNYLSCGADRNGILRGNIDGLV